MSALSLHEEVLDSQKQVKYLLWQSLLTLCGFLITVLIGISSFGLIQESNFILKIFVELSLILLFLVCGMLVLNFRGMEKMYGDLASVTRKDRKPTKQEEDTLLETSLRRGRWINTREEISIIIITGVSIILIFLTIYSVNNKNMKIPLPASSTQSIRGNNYEKIRIIKYDFFKERLDLLP